MFGVQVVGDGGRASVEDVGALIEEGEGLSVSVPKELTVSCANPGVGCKEWLLCLYGDERERGDECLCGVRLAEWSCIVCLPLTFICIGSPTQEFYMVSL